MDEQELQKIKERKEVARKEVAALCHGKDWRMCIPRQSDDSDMVIGDALDDIDALIAEVEKLRRDSHPMMYIEGATGKPMKFVVGADVAAPGSDESITVHHQPCPKCGETMHIEIEEKEAATAGVMRFKYLTCPKHGRVYLIS
jgi:hypothetical protein